MSLIKYKRDNFEYECEGCHIDGIIINSEKEMRLKNVKISKNVKVEEIVDKVLTTFLRIYWRNFHIKINKIFIENYTLRNHGPITFILDYENTPQHKKVYEVKFL